MTLDLSVSGGTEADFRRGSADYQDDPLDELTSYRRILMLNKSNAVNHKRLTKIFLSFLLCLNLGLLNAANRDQVKMCEQCHGSWGLSQTENIPRLAGMSEHYLFTSLKRFEEQKRPCRDVSIPFSTDSKTTSMCEMAASITDEQKRKLAKYFSNQRHKGANQNYDPELATLGGEVHDRMCEKCHYDAGTEAVGFGLLAGQWIPYLRLAFADVDGHRRSVDEEMQRKFSELGPLDKEALIHFYASVSGGGGGLASYSQ